MHTEFDTEALRRRVGERPNFSLENLQKFFIVIFICPCFANIIPNYNQQDATFLIYLFLQTLYVFQAVPPPIIRST